MACHDVVIEAVEVGTLGHGQDLRIEALGDGGGRKVVFDGLRGATQENRGRSGRPQALRERGRVDAFGGQSTSEHTHPSDSKAAAAYMRSIGGRSAIVRNCSSGV